MTVNGMAIIEMVMALCYGLMELDMKENGKKIGLMGKENFGMLMEIHVLKIN